MKTTSPEEVVEQLLNAQTNEANRFQTKRVVYAEIIAAEYASIEQENQRLRDFIGVIIGARDIPPRLTKLAIEALSGEPFEQALATDTKGGG